MKMQTLLSLLLTALFAAQGGLAEAQRAKPTPGETGADYRIGPEDVLQISVFSNEALSRTVPVRPDGMITLPLLNDVKAAGLTPMELRDSLMKKFVEFVPSPEVAVIVTEVKSFMISVLGEVAKPGRYDLRSSATIVDALAMAGGFKEFAARSKVVVVRSQGGVSKRIPFDYNKLSSAKAPQENFALRPGDIVIVP
jgi:polysaccharide export outer membrane protein